MSIKEDVIECLLFEIRELLTGLLGCKTYQLTSLYSETLQHRKKLRRVLHRLQEDSLHLSKDKCEILTTKIKLCGHIYSSSDLKPDPEKVEAICKASED